MNQQSIESQRYSLTIRGYEVQLATLGHVLYHVNRHETDPGFLPCPETLADIIVLREGDPMTVVEERRPSGRVFGIRFSQSEKAAFIAMIDEIDHAVLRVDGVLRAPHDMSYYDWVAARSVGSAAYNVYPCFPGESDAEVDFMSLCTEEFVRRFGYGHCGPSYDGRQTNSRHDVHVAYALMRGKAVPEHVVEWYREGPGQRKSKAADLQGFEIAIAVPELRGALTPDQFRYLASALRDIAKDNGTEVPLTWEALKPYAAVLARLGAYATSVDADNALTQAGLLKVQGMPETVKAATPTDVSTQPESAQELHTMLADAVFESTVKRLEEERGKGNLSEREYLRQMEIAKHCRATYSPAYAVEMAEAIEKRDVTFLLRVLDQADGNEISKAFMAMRYGVKLKGLNQQKRRAAIFAFCGYSAEQQAQHEAGLTRARESRLQDRAAREATELAEQVKVDTPDGVKTMRQFIDDAVAQGFNKLLKYRRGKFQWCLFNQEKGSILGIPVNHGGLAYARDALRLPVHPQLA